MATLRAGMQLAYVMPETWTDPSVREDCTAYPDVEVQIAGLSVNFVPTRSLDGTNFTACNAYDKDGNLVSTISADGIYRLPGSGYLKFSAGTATTVTIRKGS